MRLVENWRKAWTWFSMWALTALSALSALPIVWANMPEDLKAALPQGWATWVMLAIALGGIVGRVVDQKGKRPE